MAAALNWALHRHAGAETCRKYPGSLGHEALDAATYAKYGADMVKLDACGRSPLGGPDWSVQYDTWSAALRSQNKTISFSCEWPAYYDICVMETKTPSKRHPNRNISYCGLNTPWAPGPSNTHVADICQSWRYSADSFDVWNSTVQILEAATTGAPYLDTPFHKLVDTGPGAWNDADFVSAGCPTDRECGLGEKVTTPMTALEQRTQMSMWAMIASPIIIGSDVRRSYAAFPFPRGAPAKKKRRKKADAQLLATALLAQTRPPAARCWRHRSPKHCAASHAIYATFGMCNRTAYLFQIRNLTDGSAHSR